MNATFYSFKPSGKYYTHGRGNTITVDEFVSPGDTKDKFLSANNGATPGLAGPGDGFFIMVIPDDDLPPQLMGVPVMIGPKT